MDERLECVSVPGREKETKKSDGEVFDPVVIRQEKRELEE